MTDRSRLPVPTDRIRVASEAPVRARGRFVLYWMIAARRTRCSHALDRALEWAKQLDRPLVVFEPLRVDHPWASDRLHRFVLDGMADNAARFERAGVTHHPYVEPAVGAGRGALERLARDACVVVTDDFPTYFLPRMVAAAARRLPVRVEAVDSFGLLPMRAAGRAFGTAFAFRAWLQRHLVEHLQRPPRPEPLSRLRLPGPARLPADFRRRWPRASQGLLVGEPSTLAALPIDHTVAPVQLRGGSAAGRLRLRAFVDERLDRYGEDRSHPDLEGTSGLSPYLHFGHVSAHEVFDAVARHEHWSPADLGRRAGGRRAGFWHMSDGAEAFLDQLVTWRELGAVFCAEREDHDRFESLPAWAERTLQEHVGDPRPTPYALSTLERAETHDELWNAAQRQLVREGTIHNVLRMLWGKKILEWSPSPREALRVLVTLNDKYALDGRDPCSNSGIFWTLGRFDRPWGPVRPIFGTVRYMSSANMARKVRVRATMARFAAPPGGGTVRR